MAQRCLRPGNFRRGAGISHVNQISKLNAAESGDIPVAGSGKLVQMLFQHHLVNELRLMVFPVLLGGRLRLFRDGGNKVSLRLVEPKPVGSGVLTLVYHPDRK